MKSVFNKDVTTEITNRIQQLDATKNAEWGKMNVSQMLAHCNVAYDMALTDKYPKPNFIKKFMLKTFVKKHVVNEVSYPKNSRTAPEFIITDLKEFNTEKETLINNINKVQELGEAHFENKESHSFGKLKANEWNNMFYKHLDHHLQQFGV